MNRLLHHQKTPERPGGSVFVGRKRELAELRASLEAALARSGQLLLVAGEPGIGKTRLTDEFAAVARQRGVSVFWGRCWEGDGAPAFWPWVQIVRSYLQLRDTKALVTEMGANAAAIAQVIPEVHERFPQLPLLPGLDPEQTRFRFFDSCTTWLKKVSASQPLLLVLDDLHWADTPSLLLLQFLAHEMHDARLLVVGTYRDTEVGHEHPLSAALGALARESQRLNLSGFIAEEVARFIESTTGIVPTASLVTAVYEKTEGNPFFVSEIVRMLPAEQRLTAAGGKAA